MPAAWRSGRRSAGKGLKKAKPPLTYTPALLSIQCIKRNFSRQSCVTILGVMDLEQEKELVLRAKGDIQSFGELYDKYYDQILNYSLRRTASIDATRYITAEVFLKALENIKRFQWRDIPFSAWLYRIAGNEINNGFRRNKRIQLLKQELKNSASDPNTSLAAEIAQAEANIQKHEDFLTIHKNISKLPVKYQEVIALRFFEEKQIKDIGVILGKSEGTVKSLLHRGLEKLRKLME
jgi:RNA polymerase sigma-70 factor (ECF subfamily)